MSYDTGSADLYYVYGKGKLIAILSSPAEAVQLADENVGVVLNSSQSYVWERIGAEGTNKIGRAHV